MKLVVAHSGGPTAVLNASLVGIVDEARRHRARGIYGARFGIDGLMRGDLVDLSTMDRRALDAVAAAPGSVLGTSRRAVNAAELERVLSVCRSRDIDALLYTGGNGSMITAQHIGALAAAAGQPLAVIGVPKTIDNDLAATDHAPGYGSAARFFAQAVRDIGADNRALPAQVQVIEVLGRDAGWIAAATTLVRDDAEDAPHLVYFPERPLPLDRLLGDVERVYSRLNRCVVVVCEGQLDERGEPFGADVRMSSRGPLATNLAHRLALLVTERLGLKARGEKPGILGRASAASRSEVDWREARGCGRAAVRAAYAGAANVMVSLERLVAPVYRSTSDLVPLEQVAGVARRLPLEWIVDRADGQDVGPAFVDYAAPLVGPLERYPTLS
ncbi:MAG: diphosphate--fructose-6-phosphate 1-phosphotransferase [Acidobacteria bacterium]|nr:diphosphate--fructose-6-phosphate 1-phosphotransferase [Acidobacteriota bacterium]